MRGKHTRALFQRILLKDRKCRSAEDSGSREAVETKEMAKRSASRNLSRVRIEGDSAGASIQLGGITIFAPSDEILLQGLGSIGNALLKTALENPTIDRYSLMLQCVRLVGHRIDKRIFGAILGNKLRLGLLDVVPCAAISKRIFRVYVAAQRVLEFRRNLEYASALLRPRSICHIRDIRDVVLKTNARGMWSCASHIAGRLVVLGRAEYADRFSIVGVGVPRWPR